MQISKEEISADLRRILVEDLFVEVPSAKIKDADSLGPDLGLDSVGQIELVSLIEERYGLKIDTQNAAAEMKTVGATTDYVWNNLNGARSQDASVAPQPRTG